MTLAKRFAPAWKTVRPAGALFARDGAESGTPGARDGSHITPDSRRPP